MNSSAAALWVMSSSTRVFQTSEFVGSDFVRMEAIAGTNPHTVTFKSLYLAECRGFDHLNFLVCGPDVETAHKATSKGDRDVHWACVSSLKRASHRESKVILRRSVSYRKVSVMLSRNTKLEVEEADEASIG